jgi:small subunit ribosomal protein S6
VWRGGGEGPGVVLRWAGGGDVNLKCEKAGFSPRNAYLCNPFKANHQVRRPKAHLKPCTGDGLFFGKAIPGAQQILNKSRGIMNNYELMVIFTPVLSEEDYKAAQKKYAALVKENGGQIVHDNPWGLKSLAYPIQKKTTGLYWVLEFTAPSDFIEKLNIQIGRDESVLRFMATKLDKYAVEYNARKKSGVPTGTEKAAL